MGKDGQEDDEEFSDEEAQQVDVGVFAEQEEDVVAEGMAVGLRMVECAAYWWFGWFRYGGDLLSVVGVGFVSHWYCLSRFE